MAFTYQEQIQYARLALTLFHYEKTNPENLEAILSFGELVNKHSGENNAVVYDTIEYVYEQLRLLKGEDGAYDDVELYQKLTSLVREP
jgi:hypothetical protein